MIDYIRKILPRIQQYSKQLDKQEVFVDKPWVFIDEDNNNHEYMFLRDHRLIMSLNGIVKEGKWELLPNGKLLINRIQDTIMLQNMFIDDALMLLKKSGTADIPFTLINENKIPDLDVVKYLQRVQEKIQIDSPNTERGRIIESGKVVGSNFQIGELVTGQNNEILTGQFQTTNRHCDEYLVVENGKITERYFIANYIVDGVGIEIKQFTHADYISEGDMVLNYHKISSTESRFKITDRENTQWSVITNQEGKVVKIIDGSENFFFGLSILAIAIMIVLVLIEFFRSKN